MENNKNKKMFTIFIIIFLIIIIIMGYFIYKLTMDKQASDNEIIKIKDEIDRLENKINDIKTNQYSDENDAVEYRDELSNENKKVLLTEFYSNFAWGYQSYGNVLFNDGTIYTWNTTNKQDTDDYDLTTANGFKDFVLEKGDLTDIKVSSQDLDKIEEYANNLVDSIETEHVREDRRNKFNWCMAF